MDLSSIDRDLTIGLRVSTANGRGMVHASADRNISAVDRDITALPRFITIVTSNTGICYLIFTAAILKLRLWQTYEFSGLVFLPVDRQ